MSWIGAISKHKHQKDDYVVITVVETNGSTPCNTGQKIVYSGGDNFYGSIGGGNFEYKALKNAQRMLSLDVNQVEVVRYPLGASLGQCCGGYVKVMFESELNDAGIDQDQSWIKHVKDLEEQGSDFIVCTEIGSINESRRLGYKIVYTHDQTNDTSVDSSSSDKFNEIDDLFNLTGSDKELKKAAILMQEDSICYERFAYSEKQPVAVFGAGHISRALMPMLSKLPVKVYWIDDRKAELDKYEGDTSTINIVCDDPSVAVSDLPKNIYCMIITYSHQIDFDICEQVMLRDSFCYLGVIGSSIKGNKFKKRLLNKGLSENIVDKLRCPMGMKYKFIKSPIAISISIATDLINYLERKKQIQST